MNREERNVSRRQFLLTAGCAAATAGVLQPSAAVSIALDSTDRAITPPVRWAADKLAERLTSRGVAVSRCENISRAHEGDLCILIASSKDRTAANLLKKADASIFAVPDALALVPGTAAKRRVTVATGYDTRGIVYAVLELADRVENEPDPVRALTLEKAMAEHPVNTVRSVTRLFTSDVEDKPWYNDREMWPEYLTMLAEQRFNRFNLTMGIGYDFIRHVTDAYFLFVYPFLLDVPRYDVRADGLPDAERDRNLEMLQFISEQTVARGMEFQLGIWMHGYEWIDSPNPNYTISGITKQNHGPYCRDAVRLLLEKCPAISGITFRVHGESGVEEGSYHFWEMVFEGVSTCGRPVRIDMHSKGMDQSMLDVAVATRQEVTLSPKFWAEHLGMTYHQADIRELEQPKAAPPTNSLMKLSAGSRSFLRYGYGDLLREDRPWKVIHRIWPGTQRLLLWGDPVTASAYSRAFSFCGSDGVEICEPLSFKGRRGSGIAGDRCAYADTTLRPRWDWQKYIYGHRIWGRLLYNPDADPAVWRRYLQREFGDGAEHLEAALANASRILPIVTTAHGTSAANNNYWPEVYLNQSMVDAAHYQPYTDTPAPRVFGNVSPFDPQLFSRINDYADELLRSDVSGKYSPIEVAQWIEDYAQQASEQLAQAESRVMGRNRPEYRRLAIDVAIQAGLGRFFAAKFRSGVLYRIYEQTGDPTALKEALNQYRKARDEWAQLANRAKGIYMTDITVGEHPQLRGHWLDRLPALDKDIAAVEGKTVPGSTQSKVTVKQAIDAALGRPVRPQLAAKHNTPAMFRPGQPLAIELRLDEPADSVHLYYRHVNQAERYQTVAMEGAGGKRTATIPSAYTDSAYPIEYYFEVAVAPGRKVLHPGLSPSLTQQPYFVVRQSRVARS
jgi:hypothetical protein